MPGSEGSEGISDQADGSAAVPPMAPQGAADQAPVPARRGSRAWLPTAIVSGGATLAVGAAVLDESGSQRIRDLSRAASTMGGRLPALALTALADGYDTAGRLFTKVTSPEFAADMNQRLQAIGDLLDHPSRLGPALHAKVQDLADGAASDMLHWGERLVDAGRTWGDQHQHGGDTLRFLGEELIRQGHNLHGLLGHADPRFYLESLQARLHVISGDVTHAIGDVDIPDLASLAEDARRQIGDWVHPAAPQDLVDQHAPAADGHATTLFDQVSDNLGHWGRSLRDAGEAVLHGDHDKLHRALSDQTGIFATLKRLGSAL
ncbi:hypothetical protein, partial [Azospirillum sp. B4]|uniref:hypothetical protein n=1 Tax=Azospirillum sp. B4 TaxID=95605 RepID=UPI0005C9DCC9